MRLKDLRKSKKMSQSELANIFNVAQTTLSSWETGRRSPDPEMLKRIADYFDVTVDYLLGMDRETYFKAAEEGFQQARSEQLGLFENIRDNITSSTGIITSNALLEAARQGLITSDEMKSAYLNFTEADRLIRQACNHAIKNDNTDFLKACAFWFSLYYSQIVEQMRKWEKTFPRDINAPKATPPSKPTISKEDAAAAYPSAMEALDKPRKDTDSPRGNNHGNHRSTQK